MTGAAEDRDCGVGEVVKREVEISLVFADAFDRSVRQACQAAEGEVALVFAETCRCPVREVRQTVERKLALILAEILRRHV